MSDNVNVNNLETIENLLKKYQEENPEFCEKIKGLVKEKETWEKNGFGKDGNLLQLLILEYIDGNEEMIDQITERVGKIRFGNVRSSYDYRIKKNIEVDGEEKQVAVTSGVYKKYRYDNDIKAEVIPYTEKDTNAEKCLLVVYEAHKSDIVENGEKKEYQLPGIDLNNIEDVKELFFEQLDIALDREVHIDKEDKEDKEEIVENVTEEVADNVTEEVADNVTEEVADKVTEEVAEEVKDTVEEIKEEVKEDVKEKIEDTEAITDDTEEVKEDNEQENKEQEEVEEVVESVDGVIEENPDELSEEEKEEIINEVIEENKEENKVEEKSDDKAEEIEEKIEEETVPVVKENIPEERIGFIDNILFKKAKLTLTQMENTKKDLVESLKTLTKEEVEAIQGEPEYFVEDANKDVEENKEIENKEESEEIDVIPMSEIKEYDHSEDELGSDNPMVVDRTDEIPDEIKEQIIKEDKELRRNKHFKEDKEDREDRE